MTQCSARVYRPGSFTRGRCSRKGVNEENGVLWCKQHTPSIVKARSDERTRIFNEEWDKKRAKWKLDAAAPELLEALEYIEDLLSRRPFSSELWPSGEHPQTVIDKIRTVIKKASP